MKSHRSIVITGTVITLLFLIIGLIHTWPYRDGVPSYERSVLPVSNQDTVFAPAPSQYNLKDLLGKIQSTQISNNGTVIIGNENGTSRRLLSLGDLNILGFVEGIEFRYSVLSPRNDKVAFSVHGGVRDMLGVLELGSNRVGKLFEILEGGVGKPVWAPSGEYIAVTLGYASGLEEIDIVNASNGNRPIRNIVMNEFHRKELETYNPTWFDDGLKLYFSSRHIETREETKWVINVDGTGLSRLDNVR